MRKLLKQWIGYPIPRKIDAEWIQSWSMLFIDGAWTMCWHSKTPSEIYTYVCQVFLTFLKIIFLGTQQKIRMGITNFIMVSLFISVMEGGRLVTKVDGELSDRIDRSHI